MAGIGGHIRTCVSSQRPLGVGGRVNGDNRSDSLDTHGSWKCSAGSSLSSGLEHGLSPGFCVMGISDGSLDLCSRYLGSHGEGRIKPSVQVRVP